MNAKWPSIQKTVLLSLVPLVLFTVLWNIHWQRWQRLHPSPTALDERIRVLMTSADMIRVEVISYEFAHSEGLAMQQISTAITSLSPDEMLPVMKYLNLTKEQTFCYEAGCPPALYFLFYKDGKRQASIHIGGKMYGCDATGFKSSLGLHPTTVHRLKDMMARQSKIRQALLELGVEH